jgi:hypothetical protein
VGRQVCKYDDEGWRKKKKKKKKKLVDELDEIGPGRERVWASSGAKKGLQTLCTANCEGEKVIETDKRLNKESDLKSSELFRIFLFCRFDGESDTILAQEEVRECQTRERERASNK